MYKSSDISNNAINSRNAKEISSTLRRKRTIKANAALKVKTPLNNLSEVIVEDNVSTSRTKKSTKPVFGQLEKHKQMVSLLQQAYSSDNNKSINGVNQILFKKLDENKKFQRKNQTELPLIKLFRTKGVFVQALNIAISQQNSKAILQFLSYRHIRENEGLALYLSAKITSNLDLLKTLETNGLTLVDVLNHAENNIFQHNLTAKNFANSLYMLILYHLDREMHNNAQIHKLFYELSYTKNNAVDFYLTVLQNEDPRILSYLKENEVTNKNLLTHAFKTSDLAIIEKLLSNEKIKAEVNLLSELKNPIRRIIEEHYKDALLNHKAALIKIIEDSGFTNALSKMEAASLWLSINKVAKNECQIGHHTLTSIVDYAKHNLLTPQESTLNKLQLFDIVTYLADIEFLKQRFLQKNDLPAIEYFVHKLEINDKRALDVLNDAGINIKTLLELTIKNENFLALGKLIKNPTIKELLNSDSGLGRTLRNNLTQSYSEALEHNNQNWVKAVAAVLNKDLPSLD